MMTSTETRSVSALWYSWGQIDSGLFPALTIDDGFAFQREQEAVAVEYYAQRTYFMPSLLQAWSDYVARVTTSKIPATPIVGADRTQAGICYDRA